MRSSVASGTGICAFTLFLFMFHDKYVDLPESPFDFSPWYLVFNLSDFYSDLYSFVLFVSGYFFF